MSLTEQELAPILVHCRELLFAEKQLEGIKGERAEKVEQALDHWQGSHGRTFSDRTEDEGRDIDARIAGLRTEADAWARAWADTVNQINGARREAAVEDERNSRGTGESFVDFFVGDDSDQMVRSYTQVEVPTAETQYASTGGLERFD